VPTIAHSSGNNPNPDSGEPGDGGWYFSGDGDGGFAALTNGELELNGPGIDSNTAQGGIGIAKAFNNVPLGDLDALTYQWHVNEVNTSPQAPTIHITVSRRVRASSTSPTGSRRTRSGTAPPSPRLTTRAARTVPRRSRRSCPTTPTQ